MKNRFNNHFEKIRNNDTVFSDIKKILNAHEVKTIFDVGANKGQSAFLFNTNFPDAHIYSFEPDINSFNILCEKFNNNPLIIPCNFALSNEEKEAFLNINKKKTLNSLFNSGNEAYYWCNKDGDYNCLEKLKINCKKIDNIINELKIDHIDILKLDIQGSELDCLKGASKTLNTQKISLIFTEINFVPFYNINYNFEDIITYLRNSGYTLFDFYNLFNAYNGQLKCGDAIFISQKIREMLLEKQVAIDEY